MSGKYRTDWTRKQKCNTVWKMAGKPSTPTEILFWIPHLRHPSHQEQELPKGSANPSNPAEQCFALLPPIPVRFGSIWFVLYGRTKVAKVLTLWHHLRSVICISCFVNKFLARIFVIGHRSSFLVHATDSGCTTFFDFPHVF